MRFVGADVHGPPRPPRTCRSSSLDDAGPRYAADVRICVPAKLRGLLRDFLRIKRERGSAVEKEVYAGMAVTGLVDRLISKRPLMFMVLHDSQPRHVCTQKKQKNDAMIQCGTATPASGSLASP